VLRFNGVTRQSVARVWVHPAEGGGSSSNRSAPSVIVQPECLAQEYLKTLAAVIAALLGLQGLLSAQQASNNSPARLKVLCIGLGGGSLPLFLAHHFPNMGEPG
jgi:hypothetical protein